MFENKKSKNYFYFLIGIGLFFVIIFISNLFFIPKDKYKSLKVGEEFILGDEKIILKSIEKSSDYLYLELIDYNYIENLNKIKFSTKTENKVNYSIDPEILYNYKGYYLLKIHLEKGFKTLKFIVEYVNNKEDKNNLKDHTYFNEYELVINKNFKEKTKQEYILNYLSFLINKNEDKIKEKNDIFNSNNEILIQKEEEIKLLKDESQYKNEEEKLKIENKIISNSKDISSLKNKLIDIENEIIDLKNSNLLLNSEYIFIETGKKEKPQLLQKKKKDDVNSIKENNFSENFNPNNNINQEENSIKEVEIKQENNNSSSKPKNNSSSTTKKSNNNSNNSSSKPKNNSNNNGEVEVEFTP